MNAQSNPAGAIYDEIDRRALTDVLLRHPQAWVPTDDIHEHILYSGRTHSTPALLEPRLRDRTPTVNGGSKAHAMTDWRIGYTPKFPVGGALWFPEEGARFRQDLIIKNGSLLVEKVTREISFQIGDAFSFQAFFDEINNVIQ